MQTILDFIGWNDPTRRATLIRSAIGFIGYLVSTGKIPIPAFFYQIVNDPGLAAVVGALLIPAGEKNASGYLKG